jgi:glycosyltransferase involved in cell wall biosynthesis
MRIIIDGRMAQYARTGIGAYTYNLIKILSLDRNNKILVLTCSKLGSGGFDKLSNVEVIPCAPSYGAYGYREYWEQFILPDILLRNHADVYHSPNYILPFVRFSKTAMVVTQYDASLFATPQHYKFVHRNEGRFLIRRSASVADKIIYGSHHAKKEFSRFFSPELVEKKGRSIYIGLPSDITEHSECTEEYVDAVRRRLGLTRPYLVAIGSVHPRKNYERLIESMSNDLLKEFDLVICGSIAWKSKGVFDAIVRNKLESRVKITGFLETKEMVALVKGARVMVFPSFYEGFGIPPLEAFAIGTPVCASSSSSIPEVVGNAAIMFDPYSIDDLVNSVVLTAHDEVLRDKLIADGRKRLDFFSWERCGVEHMEVYTQAIFNRKNIL